MNDFLCWITPRNGVPFCVEIAAGTRLHAVRIAYQQFPQAVSVCQRECK
jgi:hypothetical protein